MHPKLFLLFLCAILIDAQTWSTASLSEARYDLAATTVGNLALFAGGVHSVSEVSNVVDIYNYTSGSWSNVSLWYASAGSAATSVGDLALFATEEKRVDIYNSTSGNWSISYLSQDRYGMTATSVGNLALFAGGNNLTGHSDRVDIYHYPSRIWSTASLSQGRYELAATTVGDLALFAGGFGNNGVSNRVDIYNYTSKVWSIASLSTARSKLAATTVGNLAFFAGGYDGNDIVLSNRVDIYNYTSGTWSTASLSQGRYDLAATTVGNLALFAGGYNEYTYSNRVDIYNYTSGAWSVASLSQGRQRLAATSIGNLALFAGGISDLGISSIVDIYTDVALSPSPTPSPSRASSPSATPAPSTAPSVMACVYTDPSTGYTYNLTDLANSTSDYQVDVPAGTDPSTTVGYRITLNICRSILLQACAAQAGAYCDACQQWPLDNPKYQNALGKTTTTSFGNALDTSGYNEEGVTMYFDGFTSTVTLNFVCDPTSGIGYPRYITKPTNTNFLLQWKSKYGCASGGQPADSRSRIFCDCVHADVTLCVSETCPVDVSSFCTRECFEFGGIEDNYNNYCNYDTTSDICAKH